MRLPLQPARSVHCPCREASVGSRFCPEKSPNALISLYSPAKERHLSSKIVICRQDRHNRPHDTSASPPVLPRDTTAQQPTNAGGDNGDIPQKRRLMPSFADVRCPLEIGQTLERSPDEIRGVGSGDQSVSCSVHPSPRAYGSARPRCSAGFSGFHPACACWYVGITIRSRDRAKRNAGTSGANYFTSYNACLSVVPSA